MVLAIVLNVLIRIEQTEENQRGMVIKEDESRRLCCKQSSELNLFVLIRVNSWFSG
jgi:hypothetical protein